MHDPRPLARTLVPWLALALLAGPLPARADRTVRCESDNYRYRYCRADTDNRVRLTRQLSGTDCREGRNWGYDRYGIWVDRGCAAEFRVGHGGSSDGAKVAGALVGLAAIAAIAANQQKQQAPQDVQSWSVGQFSGWDEYEGVTVQLHILPGGSVSGRAGSNEFTGHLEGDRLTAGRHSFRVVRSGNGFVATDERDSSHRVNFQRQSSGGY